ncbi:MAG TPA: PEGA domain-containing protein [Kofleriaceae bacterium]
MCLLATAAVADHADDLFGEGVALLDKGEAAAACAKFQEALDARPGAPGVLLNLGACNLKLNKVATALQWFREAQLRAAERGQAETELAAKQQTSHLVTSVPTIKLVLSAPLPPGALVLVDSTTVGGTFSRVEVDAGKHTISVSGPGLDRTEQTVDVPTTTPTPVTVMITVRAASPAVPAPRTPPAPTLTRDGGHRGLEIGLAAGGVAALAVGGFFAWDARYLADRRDDVLAGCTLDRPCSASRLADYDSRGKRANALEITGFAVGGVALAASAVVLVLDSRHASAVSVVPTEGGAVASTSLSW